MKKILFYLILISILITNNSFAKNFKSKNGYSLNIPKNYEVKESEYMGSFMTMLFNRKDADKGKNIMFIMISNETEVMEILRSLPEVNLGDEICNMMAEMYDEESPNKNIDLYQCTKKTKIIHNNTLKTIYDSIHPTYLQYQYTFKLNNKLIMVSGTCKKNKCGERDRKLIDLSNSIKW